MSENPVWFALGSVYAVVISVALCHLAPRIAAATGLIDHPAAIKRHARPTPVMGGLALFAVLLPLMPVFMVIYEPAGLGNRALTVIAAATLAIGFTGLVDDRRHLPAALRFGLTMLVISAAMAIEPRLIIHRIEITGMGSSDNLPYPLAFILTLLIQVGFVNAVNMADGKNGLVIGLTLIWLLGLLAVGPAGLIIVVLPLLQAFAVLLVYNLRGRVFLGDGGTYGLSAFLGMTSIYVYGIATEPLSADLLALFYLLPGIDMLRLFFARIIRGRSPMAGDRTHFHHLLEERFGWPLGLAVYLGLAASLIVAGLLWRHLVPAFFVAGLAGYAVLTAWLSLSRRRRRPAPRDETVLV